MYGSGATGKHIAALAGKAGIETILAGRNPSRTAIAADELGLTWRSSQPEHAAELDAMLAGVDILINTAGPFTHTAAALMRACIRNRCHYLDLSNEVTTFQDARALDGAARQAKISIVPGAGFGTAVTEALAAHVIERIHEPDILTIVRTSEPGAKTPAVRKTTREVLARPGAGIKDGRWQILGNRITGFDLPDGRRTGILVGLGDGFAIAEATAIGQVSTYAATGMNPGLARVLMPLIRQLFRMAPAISRGRAGRPKGSETVGTGGTQLRVQASNANGETATSNLRAESGSALAARIAVKTAQQLQHRPSPGFHTAGQILGTQQVLTLPGIQITDL
ncbi:saccharopine dehydrogenase NADP-binding domain-containing protein [Arthrobacter rhombi]|uniref:saccharopine dehydrogenase NADP-binding domain-containing protein n=1 Tax=Arthrobacter rhombi TaxID=71253 RepID=UPI003FD37984